MKPLRGVQTCCVLCMSFAVRVAAGELRVSGGEFWLEGRLAATRLELAPGAWLRGNGTLIGDLDARGNVSPGSVAPDNVGTQRVTGSAFFQSPSAFHCYAASHDTLDRLEVGDTVWGVCTVVAGNAPAAVPVDVVIIRGGPLSAFGGFAPADSWTWQLTTTGSVDLLLTHRRGDSDANGLPDEWELRNFGARIGTDPRGDPDSDGCDNENEYHANTRPHDAASHLHFTAIAGDADVSRVTWTTAEGRKYSLVTASQLDPDTWSTTAVFTVYGQPEHTWTGAVGGIEQRFYGVRVEENRP